MKRLFLALFLALTPVAASAQMFALFARGGVCTSCGYTTIAQVLAQNSAGGSQGFPWKNPAKIASYNWFTGYVDSSVASNSPPTTWTSAVAWGQVYIQGDPATTYTTALGTGNPSTDAVTIANMTIYAHKVGGGWTSAMSQQGTGNQMGCGYWAADYATDASTPVPAVQNADGSATCAIPPPGDAINFFPPNRGTFTAGSVDGVYATAQVKINNGSIHYLANIGADWWLDSGAISATYVAPITFNGHISGGILYVDDTIIQNGASASISTATGGWLTGAPLTNWYHITSQATGPVGGVGTYYLSGSPPDIGRTAFAIAGVNTGMGESNWVVLTTSYQTIFFTTRTPAQLLADPPPGISPNAGM